MLMNLPFALPAWMPDWVFLLLALPVLLYALAFLLMPFSVFGVKARIEALEAQIESLHDDLRIMGMRASGALPPSSGELGAYEDVPNFGRIKKSRAAVPELDAPLPATRPMGAAPMVAARERPAPPPPRPARRTEPRLD